MFALDWFLKDNIVSEGVFSFKLLLTFVNCRNTDMWTTSCLRITLLLTASWTSGERQETNILGTYMDGTQSTKTFPSASGLKWLRFTSLLRYRVQGLGFRRSGLAVRCGEVPFQWFLPLFFPTVSLSLSVER